MRRETSGSKGENKKDSEESRGVREYVRTSSAYFVADGYSHKSQ
jgi:hypothetical protein